MLCKLEILTFFSALRLAVILEGAAVCWMSGSLLRVLIDRVTVMLHPPRYWIQSDWMPNRRTCLRQWCLAMAQVAMPGVSLVLGKASAAS